MLPIDIKPIARIHYFRQADFPFTAQRNMVMQFRSEMCQCVFRKEFLRAIARQCQVEVCHASFAGWVRVADSRGFRLTSSTKDTDCCRKMTGSECRRLQKCKL